MTSLEESKNKNIMIILILIVGILLVSLLTSIVVDRKNTKAITSYVMQILSKYTLGISSEISTAVGKVAAETSTIQNMQEDVSGEKIRNALYLITVDNINTIRNIAIITRKNSSFYTCISSISTKDAGLLAHYKKLINSVPGNIQVDSFPVMLPPYEEKMGHSIILPFVVYCKKNNTFACFEVNTTTVLMNMRNVQKTSLLNHELPVIINIYDNKGLLLETTDNIKRKTVNTLQQDDIFPQFNSYDNSLELFTFSTKNTIWMMQRDSDIGLSVAVCVPAGFIARSTTTVRFAILFIAMLSSIAIIFTLLVTFKVAKNYQQLAALQAETRFYALQSKMRPHLLFNTLDSIVCAIEGKDSASALACIKALAYILQLDLRDNNAEISMSKQVKYLRSYISLQKIRYRDKFDFNLDIDLNDYSIDNLKILKFCVEPLVENCFVHSVYQGLPFTHIAVTYKITGKLIITVINDSVLVSEKKFDELQDLLKIKKELDTSHIGLLSINERIRLLYGKEYGLDILPVEKGFSVKVRLPVLTESP